MRVKKTERCGGEMAGWNDGDVDGAMCDNGAESVNVWRSHTHPNTIQTACAGPSAELPHICCCNRQKHGYRIELSHSKLTYKKPLVSPVKLVNNNSVGWWLDCSWATSYKRGKKNRHTAHVVSPVKMFFYLVRL